MDHRELATRIKPEFSVNATPLKVFINADEIILLEYFRYFHNISSTSYSTLSPLLPNRHFNPAFPGQLLKDRVNSAHLIPVHALNLLRSILRSVGQYLHRIRLALL